MSQVLSCNFPSAPISSKIMQMLNAKERLPERLKTLFDLLFIKGMTEEQAGAHLDVDAESITRDKQIMMKSLKAASS